MDTPAVSTSQPENIAGCKWTVCEVDTRREVDIRQQAFRQIADVSRSLIWPVRALS
jgi:hypothetical protein